MVQIEDHNQERENALKAAITERELCVVPHSVANVMKDEHACLHSEAKPKRCRPAIRTLVDGNREHGPRGRVHTLELVICSEDEGEAAASNT